MPLYRAYEINGDGHVVGPPLVIKLVNDAEAIAYAARLAGGYDMEIWEEGRRVGVIKRHLDDGYLS